VLEEATGSHLSEHKRELVTTATDEIDLVRSGLDDTMRTAYGEMRAAMHENEEINDLRTAAFAVAIKKISRSYTNLGIY